MPPATNKNNGVQWKARLLRAFLSWKRTRRADQYYWISQARQQQDKVKAEALLATLKNQ